MTKKRLLIFSDSFAYSGSENVIENIHLSKKVNASYEIYFIYGYNRSYESRFRERFKLLGINPDKTQHAYLLSPDWSINQYNRLNRMSLRKLILFCRVVILKILKSLFITHAFNYIVLKRKFKKISPHIIYINNGGYPASLQCCLAAFVANSMQVDKLYFNINNMATPWCRYYDKFLDEHLDKFVTKFTTASLAAQHHAIKVRSLSKDKFMRIPNTIYNDILLKEQYPATNKISNATIFGSVGLLTYRKGYHVLLEAVKILVYEYGVNNFKVTIIGDGEEKQRLLYLCKDFKITEYVDFLGFRSNPLNELKDFDVFVLPSVRNEDLPYVILEAMLLSKPIIGTRVAGIPEQIDAPSTGLLIDPNNAVDLAAGMLKIMSDKENIKNMGVKSQEKYISEFSYSHIEEMYSSIFAD